MSSRAWRSAARVWQPFDQLAQLRELIDSLQVYREPLEIGECTLRGWQVERPPLAVLQDASFARAHYSSEVIGT